MIFRRRKTHTAGRSSCRVEPLEDERGFRIIGDIDFPDVQSVKESLEPELCGTLVLDLAAVHSIVDDGLGLLVGALKRLRARGGSLVIRNPSGEVQRIFERTGLSKVFTIENEASRPCIPDPQRPTPGA